MIFLVGLSLITIIIICVLIAIKSDFYKGRCDDTQKRLYNEIEQLDDYVEENQNNTSSSAKKIMIPDEVNIKESSLKSTQDIDCKQYTVSDNNGLVKNVIGTKNKIDKISDNVILNEDSDEDDPIKNM